MSSDINRAFNLAKKNILVRPPLHAVESTSALPLSYPEAASTYWGGVAHPRLIILRTKVQTCVYAVFRDILVGSIRLTIAVSLALQQAAI